MNDILFEVLKLVVIVAVFLVTRYLVPYIKEKIGIDKIELATKWVNDAVLMAQQVYKDWDGADKKAFVIDFMKDLLISKKIALSPEQLDVLIEAAVKQMKISENKTPEPEESEDGIVWEKP